MQTVTLTNEQYEMIHSAAYSEGKRFAEMELSRDYCEYTNSRLRAAWFAGYDSFRKEA